MRAYYSSDIGSFLKTDTDTILAKLAYASEAHITDEQKMAWRGQTAILERG